MLYSKYAKFRIFHLYFQMSLTMKFNNNSTNRDAQSKNETDNAMWSIYLKTKLDDFFPEAMFMVDNFSIWKSNRNQHRGDALAYVRSYLTREWKNKQVFKDLESVGY